MYDPRYEFSPQIPMAILILHAITSGDVPVVHAQCQELNVSDNGVDANTAISALRTRIQGIFTPPYIGALSTVSFEVQTEGRFDSAGSLAFRRGSSGLIPAGVTDLRRMFLQHVEIAGNCPTTSHSLLLFYGVECGLKAAYLKVNNLVGMHQIFDERLARSHDLGRWVKELRMPAGVGPCPGYNLISGPVKVREGQTAHQAWRYGARVVPANELTLKTWLNGLIGKLRATYL